MKKEHEKAEPVGECTQQKPKVDANRYPRQGLLVTDALDDTVSDENAPDGHPTRAPNLLERASVFPFIDRRRRISDRTHLEAFEMQPRWHAFFYQLQVDDWISRPPL